MSSTFIMALVWLYVFTMLGIRTLRWLAIVQQKEYRWDRLKLFIQTPEGRRDVWRVWPVLADFTKTGLKRPKPTTRVLVIAGITGGLYLAYFELMAVPWLSTGSMFSVVLLLGLWLLIIPELVVLALVPTWIVFWLVMNNELKQAQSLIQKHAPYIIGITGSYGKSSTKHILAYVLASHTSVFVTPKSHNTRYSVAKAINAGYKGQKVAVIEYAAYTKGEIRELASWFPPDVAVITGLSPQHLALFGSVENIVKAKSELVKAALLKNKAKRDKNEAAPHKNEAASIWFNGQDEGAEKICITGGAKHARSFSGSGSVVAVKHVGLTETGHLTFVWRGHTIVTRLVGRQYLSAVQAGLALGLQLGMSEPELVRAITSFEPPQDSYIQTFESSFGSLVIDDGGTSNKAGFKAALELAEEVSRKHKPHYKIALVTAGIIDLGTESDAIHQDIASQASKMLNAVVYLGSEGRVVFQKQFREKFFQGKEGWSRLHATLDDRWLVLIEGKVPQWVYDDLKTKK